MWEERSAHARGGLAAYRNAGAHPRLHSTVTGFGEILLRDAGRLLEDDHTTAYEP